MLPSPQRIVIPVVSTIPKPENLTNDYQTDKKLQYEVASLEMTSTFSTYDKNVKNPTFQVNSKVDPFSLVADDLSILAQRMKDMVVTEVWHNRFLRVLFTTFLISR